MATTEIQLAKTYKNIITNAVNYYNSLIRNILNTRLPNATKNRYINTVKIQFQAYVKSVNKTYEANLIKLLKPLDPKITKNKKALLIGINYIGTPNQLNGCINDIN